MQTTNASSDANDDVGAVWWIVSKVGSGSETEIQVVIADDGDGLSAKLVAYDVRHLIEKGISSSFTINQSIQVYFIAAICSVSTLHPRTSIY